MKKYPLRSIPSIIILIMISALLCFIACNPKTTDGEANSDKVSDANKEDVNNQDANATAEEEPEEVKDPMNLEEATEYINGFYKDVLLPAGMEYEISSIEAADVYKIEFKVQGRNHIAYLDKTATHFAPQVVKVKEIEDQRKKADQANEPTPKSDRPKVDIFIMSHCPFGVQILKGIIPVMETLKDHADINIRFVNYLMHGKMELDENLRMHCIQKNYPEKFIPYLKCFVVAELPGTIPADKFETNVLDKLESDTGKEQMLKYYTKNEELNTYELNQELDSQQVKQAQHQLQSLDFLSQICLDQVELTTTDLENCISSTDETLNITKDFTDEEKTNWMSQRYPPFPVDGALCDEFEVRGSPTIIINGKQIQAAQRNPAALLKEVCNAFNEPPDVCNTELTTDEPSRGFGE